MSRRTKGFFDQAGPSKPKSFGWHSSKTNNSNYQRDIPSDRHVHAASLPPIPATIASKNKLNAFRLDRLAAEDDVQQQTNIDEIKENRTADAMSSATGLSRSRPASDPASRKLGLPHANTFPSTPGDKLTLEELIGHVEVQQVQEVDGPEEILGWNPMSSCDDSDHKRKRSHSSSPELDSASSDRRNASQAHLAALAETPMVDPAAELWRRYGADKSTGDASNPPGIAFAFQASPRPLETPSKPTGFRRWASTGNDWPTSNAKRRRGDLPADGSVWKHGPSKVAALVEKMQASLAKQHIHERSVKRSRLKDPSSSSPLPADAISPRRPLTALATDAVNNAASNAAKSRSHAQRSPTRRRPNNAHLDQKVTKSSTAASLGRSSNRQCQPHQAVTETATQTVAPATVPLMTAKDLDEFDEDFSIDDLAEVRVPQQEETLCPAKERQASPAGNLEPTPVHGHEKPPTAPIINHDDFDDDMTMDEDDEFGLDDIDESGFIAAELHATQSINTRTPKKRRHSHKLPASTSQKSTTRPTRYRRLRVDRVAASTSADCAEEVVLICEAEDAQQTLAVTLRGTWVDTVLAAGDVIHITPSPAQRDAVLEHSPGQIMLDDSQLTPLLILQPDHMLSATTVADSFDCIRKAVLQDRIKVTGETSKPMVYGKILHEIFQQALLANTWHEDQLRSLVRSTIAAHLESLWELGMEDSILALEEIQGKMKEVSAWAHIFIRSIPAAAAKLSGVKDDALRVAITGLVAIEEHVWSPMFGLKGNVDATVQITMKSKTESSLIAPFEIKTGRTTNAATHHAQTSLYTLLMSDRYDIPVKAGILYYLESSDISHVDPSMAHIRQMIQQRNRVASYIHRAKHPLLGPLPEAESSASQPVPQTGFPSVIKAPYKCGRCYAQQSCFTYHALCEEGTAETSGMVDDRKKDHSMVWKEALGHLLALQPKKTAEAIKRQDQLKTWFSKWDRLLTFEEHENSRIRKELWTMSSKAREGVGRGFGRLRIRHDLTAVQGKLSSSLVDGIEGSSGKVHRYVYVFERRDSSQGTPLNEGTQLTKGEPVVVSSEAGQWALAIGYVLSSSKDSITVAVDRRLGNARQKLAGFDDESNQQYQGIMRVDKDGGSSNEVLSQQTYRLDKDEFANALSKVRANLVAFMSQDVNNTRLRELVIFGGQPVFVDAVLPPQLAPSQLGEMNDDQRAAANKVISAEDYALVLGMPGTGKTTTIAHLIRTLLAEGKSILLTSYTHTAVDNILLKIRDIAPAGGILRFGMPSKIHPAVREFCQLTTTPRDSIAEIDELYMRSQIVATTCMGTNHALFTRRTFDVCIIDEASQITLPISLGPLLSSRKFILVGDHYQLPPLVQNQAALEGGLDMSLFRMLCEQQPQAIAELGKQYRMCKEIMSISNTLVYNGRLRCGSEEVANRRLQLSQPDGLSAFHKPGSVCQSITDCWIHRACRPESNVVFLNTDSLGAAAQETLLTASKNMTNRSEGLLTTQLVISLQAMGLSGSETGVITLYRSQIAFLRQLFANAAVSRDVELDSADRFQGRDKECIIISMVRSNDAGIVGDLIKDWRRLNVAFTRARSKLIVIGSRRTLSKNELMARFLELADGSGWVVNLPAVAETCHDPAFMDVSQATENIVASKGIAASAGRSPLKGSAKLENLSPARRSSRKNDAWSPSARSPLQSIAANRASAGSRQGRQPGKIVKGSQQAKLQGGKRRKEQLAIEIMEDLMAEDWS